jgi:hypothetical protein
MITSGYLPLIISAFYYLKPEHISFWSMVIKNNQKFTLFVGAFQLLQMIPKDR